MALVSNAHAQTQDSTVATQLFNTGRDLMKAGDFAAACPKLEESARLDAKVGTLARLAECEEKIGHLASARGRWQQALNVAEGAHDDRIAHVRDELARIDALVPKLVLEVEAPVPADLLIQVDSLRVGLASVGVALPVDAGRHTVSASAKDRKTWSTTMVTFADGATSKIHIPPLESAATDAPVPASAGVTLPPPQPERPAPSRTLQTVGLVVGGVGVVGLGVATAFAVIAKQKDNESNTGTGACSGNSCGQQGDNERTQARSDGNTATVFLVAGGALAAGGLLTGLLAPRPHTPDGAAARLDVSPFLAPGLAGLTLRSKW
jgi:hypothetical protein